MSLTKSKEDYLEAILMIEHEKEKVKSVDIAHQLNVSKPGVTKAMNSLKEEGLIQDSYYSEIILTQLGRELAEQILYKHNTIKEFLLAIGVSQEIAEIDCCKIEHVISNETFEQVKKYLNKKWLELLSNHFLFILFSNIY